MFSVVIHLSVYDYNYLGIVINACKKCKKRSKLACLVTFKSCLMIDNQKQKEKPRVYNYI